jgi:pimeloyl-[acyl-carrier protein] methyl ester esterase
MMHIETLGNGPNLVLLHGWAMHAGIFAPLSERLAETFRVHLVDLPGHGFSRDDLENLEAAQCAAALAARLPRALWVGWSLGGLVALHAALDHADHVRGLALIASSPRFVAAADWPNGVKREVFEQFDAGLRSNYRATIERFLALEALGSEHTQACLHELRTHVFERGEPVLAALQAGMQMLEMTDLRARLPRLSMPSAWLAGRRDRLVPAAAMRWAAQQSPQGQFVEFPSGHAPFIGHADKVAAAITIFAQGLPA